MDEDVIISVEALGKKYRVRHLAQGRRYVALRDVLAQRAKGLFKKQAFQLREAEPHNGAPQQGWWPCLPRHTGRLPSEEFWALRNVNFQVRTGEVFRPIWSWHDTHARPASVAR